MLPSSVKLLLLVDDDSADIVIALRALRRSNLPIEVRTARSGREALAALRIGEERGESDDGPQPRAIFLDLRMPGIDGFEVLRMVRSDPATQSIPIVMLSTSSRPDDIRRAYELGANSYLVKQQNLSDPGAFIAQAARYWVELNSTPQAGVTS